MMGQLSLEQMEMEQLRQQVADLSARLDTAQVMILERDATIADTCTQHGVAWRRVAAGDVWVMPLVDLVCPFTGAIVQVEHAARLSTRIRPPAVAGGRYDPARVRWRMGKVADRIAQAIAEI